MTLALPFVSLWHLHSRRLTVALRPRRLQRRVEVRQPAARSTAVGAVATRPEGGRPSALGPLVLHELSVGSALLQGPDQVVLKWYQGLFTALAGMHVSSCWVVSPGIRVN